jgi:hypothetical protein
MVEIVYVEGFEPTAIAVNDFVSLNARTTNARNTCKKEGSTGKITGL